MLRGEAQRFELCLACVANGETVIELHDVRKRNVYRLLTLRLEQ